MSSNAVDLFPFPSFRTYQKEALVEAELALWGKERIPEEIIDKIVESTGPDKDREYFENLAEKENDVVVLDLPTGVGKSGINVALGRRAESAFYTTPQKKLRNQLENDDVLNNYYKPLRARRDYTCGATGKNCESCPIANDDEKSCFDTPDCTYANNKVRAMGSQMAVITFAYLIVDNYLPMVTEDGKQISFGNRELLCIDEFHSLENQVAGMFAGFKVSPYTVPSGVYRDAARRLDWETSRGHEVTEVMDKLVDRCKRFVNRHNDNPTKDDEVDKCESFLQKASYFFEEMDEGRDWVVNMDRVTRPGGSGKVKSFELKPVKVDRFLRKFIWSRAQKVVLSTATMPYRDKPGQLFRRLGLDSNRAHVVSYPMPFPKENRPVFTNSIIGKMSGDGVDEHWGEIMTKMNELSGEHENQKGLVHTASYDRARRFYESANSGNYSNLYDNVMLHEGGDAEEVIEEWQNSDKDILATPSMMEGVDLYDSRCRWQVLMKVPYPSPGDSRVDYYLNEKPGIGWPWYYEQTALDIVQSVGRAVRSEDDWASFYVLDESFNDVRQKATFPEWFKVAIVESDESITSLSRPMSESEETQLMSDLGIIDESEVVPAVGDLEEGDEVYWDELDEPVAVLNDDMSFSGKPGLDAVLVETSDGVRYIIHEPFDGSEKPGLKEVTDDGLQNGGTVENLRQVVTE